VGERTEVSDKAPESRPDPDFNDLTSGRDSEPRSLEDQVEAVRSWASGLAAEDDPPRMYLPPEAVKQIITRIETSPRSLDFVLARQGTGKSAAAVYIESVSWKGQSIAVPSSQQAGGDAREPNLGMVVRFKWREPGNFVRQFAESVKRASEGGGRSAEESEFAQCYDSELDTQLEWLARTSPSFDSRLSRVVLEKKLVSSYELRYYTKTLRDVIADAEDRKGRAYHVASALSLLSKSKREQVDKEALLRALVEKVDAILTDMPDYKRKDSRLISSDLSEFSGFWQDLLSRGWRGHAIIFMQEELFGGHYVEGKAFRLEIAPFKLDELVGFYKELFGGCNPFTEEALSLVAGLSRGIFRRYKRYVLLCLERWDVTKSGNRGDKIDSALVREAVSEGELVKDLELELVKLFPREESAGTAARAISVVAKSVEPVNQKTLAEMLGVSQDVIGRILETLGAHGYISRESTTTGKVVRVA
jgi:hypothetical protein